MSSLKYEKNLNKLIAAVHARDVLWDKQYRGHRNRYKLDRCWNEVAAEIGATSYNAFHPSSFGRIPIRHCDAFMTNFTAAEFRALYCLMCRKRWKNLKDQCRKEMKKNPTNSEWPHFHKLSFIHNQFLVDDDDNADDVLNDDMAYSAEQEENENKRSRLGFSNRKKLNTKKRNLLDIDADKLIQLVAAREIIWNRQDKRHHNWYKLDRCWKEIAEELGVTRDEARLKWKYIRDTARREYRKQDSEWQYLSKLEFLINQFSEYSEGMEEDLDPDLNLDDQSYVLDQDLKDADDEFETKPVIVETDFYDDGEEQPQTHEVVEDNKDEDVSFFNSLLPHVKKLDPAKKMMLRMKIQEIEIGAGTGAVDIEDKNRDRYHDGHVSIVDITDVKIHSMPTRAMLVGEC
ncbi:Transcription factor Adf-1 [Eumeta japonica]|uniref:Transcription factor Adf-1 n=1 Tax=Eumeta variegata TaxID=151549 RepID=A0A4C1VTP1_EUMVA|nr:Transcription factor Adf-1 [Eumeta japonica]